MTLEYTLRTFDDAVLHTQAGRFDLNGPRDPELRAVARRRLKVIRGLEADRTIPGEVITDRARAIPDREKSGS